MTGIVSAATMATSNVPGNKTEPTKSRRRYVGTIFNLVTLDHFRHFSHSFEFPHKNVEFKIAKYNALPVG
jgi:hypothetical protein